MIKVSKLPQAEFERCIMTIGKTQPTLSRKRYDICFTTFLYLFKLKLMNYNLHKNIQKLSVNTVKMPKFCSKSEKSKILGKSMVAKNVEKMQKVQKFWEKSCSSKMKKKTAKVRNFWTPKFTHTSVHVFVFFENFENFSKMCHFLICHFLIDHCSILLLVV